MSLTLKFRIESRHWLVKLEKQYAEKQSDKELAELIAEAESDKLKDLKAN